jgi:hypothetical protein
VERGRVPVHRAERSRHVNRLHHGAELQRHVEPQLLVHRQLSPCDERSVPCLLHFDPVCPGRKFRHGESSAVVSLDAPRLVRLFAGNTHLGVRHTLGCRIEHGSADEGPMLLRSGRPRRGGKDETEEQGSRGCMHGVIGRSFDRFWLSRAEDAHQ